MLKTILLLLAVVLAGLVVVAWSSWRFNRAIGDDVRRLSVEAKPTGRVVTEEMLTRLPQPAHRYLAASGIVGKTVPSLVRLKQRGRIRSDARSAWMNLESEEFYSTNPPAFVWRAYFPRPSMPVVVGRDEYLDGAGSIRMKMLGVYSVADEHDDELAAAGLMRYLNEMMWFPAAFLGDNVTIAPVDDSSFTAIITDRGMTGSQTSARSASTPTPGRSRRGRRPCRVMASSPG